MATTTRTFAPVELPTGRRSYLNTGPTPDIHDPNWIPVLDAATLKQPLPSVGKEPSHSAQGSFSLFPATQTPASPKPRPPISHHYSKSSLAPESIPSDSRSQSPQENFEPPVPKLGGPVHTAIGNHRRQTSTGGASTEEKISVGTENPSDVVSGSSTDGTASIAGDPWSNRRELQGTSVSHSRRSSTTSRKAAVAPPTSKYNRKNVASMANSVSGRPSVPVSVPQTPHESPRLGPSTPAPVLSSAFIQSLPSPKIPPADVPQPETVSAVKIMPMKSTASERRYRALHSHPSNVSLRSLPRDDSGSDEVEIVPKPPSVRHKPRKSTESRHGTSRSGILDAYSPTPAPTTPLPQLPPEAAARRPSTRDGSSSRPHPVASTSENPMPSSMPTTRQPEHVEMASFMTNKNTVVFRRFDEVHVRLLLCLQDEISSLETELQKLDAPTSATNSSDQLVQRTKIMRELRKVVAEYDQLFQTWNSMKASKTRDETRAELKQWLDNSGAKQDSAWVDSNAEDLSSLSLNAEATPKEKEPQKGNAASGGGGGFMALFNCGGKRK